MNMLDTEPTSIYNVQVIKNSMLLTSNIKNYQIFTQYSFPYVFFYIQNCHHRHKSQSKLMDLFLIFALKKITKWQVLVDQYF